jgi:Tol biopolymer transport system component
MIDLATGAVTPLPNNIAGVGSYFAVSPDGRTVAYSSCCSPPAPLFVANLDGMNEREITGTGADAYGAQWSPDGSLIVFQERDNSTQHLGDIVVVDADGGNRTQLTNLDQTTKFGWWFMSPSFAPDGDSILFHMPRRGAENDLNWGLWSVPVTGGEPTIVRHNAGWGDYSPDGRSLAYVARLGEDFTGDTLSIVSVDGRKATPVVEGEIGGPRWSPDGTQISFNKGGSIFVLNVASGSTMLIADGGNAEWVDDHTLIIGPGGGV